MLGATARVVMLEERGPRDTGACCRASGDHVEAERSDERPARERESVRGYRTGFGSLRPAHAYTAGNGVVIGTRANEGQ